MDNVHPLAKLVRLQNGEDIVADVIEMEDEKGVLYTLFHPLKVLYTTSVTEGYTAISFTPWVFESICDQQEFIIHAEDVMFMADVTEKVNTYYWENVDTDTSEPKEKSRQEKIREAADMEYDDYLDPFYKKVYH